MKSFFCMRLSPAPPTVLTAFTLPSWAGLPPVVIKRAEQVLDALEHDKKNQKINDLADDLPLFASVQKKVAEEEVERFSPVEEALEAVNPDELTPREALEKLYEIKALL